MRLPAALVACLTFLLAACVQSGAASLVVRLTPDDPTTITVSGDIRVLEDPAGRLRLSDVRANPNGFHAPTGRPRPAPDVYWQRLELQSALPREVELSISTSGWDHVDYSVVRRNGAVVTLHGGMLEPIHDPDSILRSWNLQAPFATTDVDAYPRFALKPGEHVTLYARGTGGARLYQPRFSISLRRFSEYLERSRFQVFVTGMIVGLFFALTIYHLLIYLSTRDTNYLWYSAYLALGALSFVTINYEPRSFFTEFFAPGRPVLSLIFKRVGDQLFWSALIFFTRSFFRTRTFAKRWDNVLLAIVAALMLQLIVSITFRIPNQAGAWLWNLAGLACFITAVYAYRRGNRAPYFIAGQAVVILSNALAAFSLMNVDVLEWMPDRGILAPLHGVTILFLATAIDALLFSLALADRLRRMRGEVSAANLEREAGNRLLYNVLPAAIADELRTTGATPPRRFDDVTILFADLTDFTVAAASMPPAMLVAELNDIFSAFDDIVEQHGLEKIKTIGDAYMAVSGIPELEADHAERAVRAAFAMLDFIDRRSRTSAIKWQIRSGLHSGTVVAGVVGKRKFTYDVWGDTVNIAARIQSAAAAETVAVSAYTYSLVTKMVAGEYVGKVALKGKGEIDTYVVRVG